MVWNLLYVFCLGRVLGEVRGEMNVLMFVFDIEGFSDFEVVRGGLFFSIYWGDVVMVVVFLLGFFCLVMWNWCDVILESILWEVWGEMRDFLWFILVVLVVLVVGVSALILFLFLMFSFFSLGLDLGF